MGAEQQVLARQHAFFYLIVDRFARYATSTNRALSHAIEDLERAQAARKERESAAARTSADEKQPAPEVVDAVAGKSRAELRQWRDTEGSAFVRFNAAPGASRAREK